ncbi:MAG: DUF3300 domain-containing protein [Proteobacteria bacterium]|nr:DUF3300 domain-containing protein [Pseudomonadota bacterium]
MKQRLFSFLSSQMAVGSRGALVVAMACSLSMTAPAFAQDGFNTVSAAGASQTQEISQEVLDGLLAPIALYPDVLLAQVLMAATYPMDVIEAARWQREHSNLSGQTLQDALIPFDWDPSVKSLVTVPQVLQYMNDEPRWMQDLGNAVLADQPRVMASAQTLRQKAQAAGTLTSNDKQMVSVDTDTTTRTQYITIAPASPQVVYVPVYDPMVVYGTWWWPSRPVYWGPPVGVTFSSGFFWGFNFYPSVALWGGFNWGGGMLTINAPVYRAYYRAPPPMMGPRNVWRRPPPVYSAPVGGHYRRPPYSPHVVRPPVQRPPSYAPGPGHNNNQRPPSAKPPNRPGTPPTTDKPHNTGQNNAKPPQTRQATPPGANGPRGNAPEGGGGNARQVGGQPVSPGNASSRSASPPSRGGADFQGGGGGDRGGGGGRGHGGR